MIIKSIIKIVIGVKNHGFEIANNVLIDFKNFLKYLTPNFIKYFLFTFSNSL